MTWRVLADLTVGLHLAFVMFVVLGGLLVLRWPKLAWVHLPVALYGVLIEWVGWVCPLTPLENWLRGRAGGAGYTGGFVEHYILPLLYPRGLTRGVQLALAVVVIVVNVAAYWLVRRRLRERAAPAS